MIRIIPAYGRSYPTSEAVVKAWEANSDFKELKGSYLNKADWKKYSQIDTVVYDYKGVYVFLEMGVV